MEYDSNITVHLASAIKKFTQKEDSELLFQNIMIIYDDTINNANDDKNKKKTFFITFGNLIKNDIGFVEHFCKNLLTKEYYENTDYFLREWNTFLLQNINTKEEHKKEYKLI